MSKNRKSSPKAKVLTILLLVLFGGSCAVLVFAVCTGQLSRDNSNESYTYIGNVTISTSVFDETVVSTDSVLSSSAYTEPSTEAQTSETTAQSVSLASIYKIKSVCDENGNAMELRALFGADFKEGSVEFSDGRFVIDVPVHGNSDAYGGEYNFISDVKIELRYDNSDIKYAYVTDIDENGAVKVLDVTMSGDFVITCTAY